MNKITVPFFISHHGCPHTCVFCDQRTISGTGGPLPTAEQIISKIDTWRTTAGERLLEIAFFGGTFTALPKHIQKELLDPVHPFLKDGIVDSIRISTRPDYITAEHVKWLSGMGVRTIELGVQSMDDTVLNASGRGHSAADSINAIRIIKSCGISVGAQLMPGLPGDTPVNALDSLERVISAGVDFVRIYPVVVLRGTDLAAEYVSGSYVPLTLEHGIELCKVLLHRAKQAGTPVIRIGLQADHGLDGEHVVAGCWHPALGQMVRSRLYADLVCRYAPIGLDVSIYCHPSRQSDVIGIRRCNERKILEKCGVRMQVIPDAALCKDEIKVQTESICSIYSIIKDNHYSIQEV